MRRPGEELMSEEAEEEEVAGRGISINLHMHRRNP